MKPVLILLLAVFSWSMDSRYYLYGEISTDPFLKVCPENPSLSKNPVFPYRIGYIPENFDSNLDYITIGALDEFNSGVFKGKDMKYILENFYTMDTSAKAAVLQAQMADQAPRLQKYMDLYFKTFPDRNFYVEIANEPNVYPSMSPELYARYYVNWMKQIQGMSFPRGQVKLLMAGLWNFEGLPKALLGTIRAGQKVYELKNPKFDPIILNTEKYYTRVFAEMRKLGFEPKNIIDIGNLHWYPYVDVGSDFSRKQHEAWINSMIDLVSQNSGTGKVWITEVGNVNPNMSDLQVAWFLKDFVFEIWQTRKVVERWYYFKNTGEDDKLNGRTSVLGLKAPLQGLTQDGNVRALGRQYLALASGEPCGEAVQAPFDWKIGLLVGVGLVLAGLAFLWLPFQI